ncbi:hypothetical protein MLD38_031227 [Melastoma candidum]|uniref:Uncharacterized protein n=1 Tax=Melastoma candidum TaxID=119954 RepID=A0ACB9MQ83_9MYRT|nr:hypothetical protein MLD38_031227 [Melastoma candidum]
MLHPWPILNDRENEFRQSKSSTPQPPQRNPLDQWSKSKLSTQFALPMTRKIPVEMMHHEALSQLVVNHCLYKALGKFWGKKIRVNPKEAIGEWCLHAKLIHPKGKTQMKTKLSWVGTETGSD